MDLAAVCIQLAEKLDDNDTSTVSEVAQLLDQYPNDIVISLIRDHLGIRRLVEHSLDIHPDFGKLLDKLSKPLGV